MNLRNKLISLITVSVLAFLIVFVIMSVNSDSEKGGITGQITSLSEIGFVMSFPDNSSVVTNAWFDEINGIYYIFVPKAVKSVNVDRICDLTVERAGEHISINFESDILEKLSPDIIYTYELRLEDGNVEKASFEYKVLDDIPSLFLDTESGGIEYISESKGNEEPGALHFYDEDGMERWSGNLESVRSRGNTSFYAPKKNYVLDFDNSVNLFGNGKSEKWFLMSQYSDGTMIRSALAYSYIEDHSNLAYIDVSFADLYVNGVYEGMYLLGKSRSASNFGLTDLEEINRKNNPEIKDGYMETIVSDDGLVHAWKLPHTPVNHTGGYMLEVIEAPDFETTFPAFVSSHGIMYELKSPDNASLDEVLYIKSQVDEMEKAIYSEDGINPETGKRFDEYIDISKWVQYFLIKEGMSDADISQNISVYMSKDADDKCVKLQMGPVWDVDTLFGVVRPIEYTYMSDPEFLQRTLIYSDALLEFDDVRYEIARCLDEELIPWYENEMKDDINGLYDEMIDSYLSNNIRWSDNDIAGTFFSSPEGNAMMMHDYMGKRCNFLRSVFEYGDTWHTVTFMSKESVYKIYSIKDGEHLKYIPSPSDYLALFVGWDVSPEINVDSLDEVIVTEDMTFDAMWMEGKWLLEHDADSIKKVIENTDIFMFDTDDMEGLYEAIITAPHQS